MRSLDSRQVAGRLRNIETPMAVFRMRRKPERYVAMYRNTVMCELEIERPSTELEYIRTFEAGDWELIDVLEAIENG